MTWRVPAEILPPVYSFTEFSEHLAKSKQVALHSRGEAFPQRSTTPPLACAFSAPPRGTRAASALDKLRRKSAKSA